MDVTSSIVAGQIAAIDYDIEPYQNDCRPTNPACVAGTTCPDCDFNSNGHAEPDFTLQTQLVLYRNPVATDFLVGEGLGAPNGNGVRVFDGSGTATPVDFQAYGAGRFGVNVAAGDVNGGDTDEILTGPGPGDVFGPQVRAFVGAGTPIGKINYFAYGTLRYGLNVAGGDVDRDWYGELVTGAGPDVVFAPQVRGWNVDGGATTALATINFLPAYAPARYGVNVAAADVDADLYAELATVPGPSPALASHVLGFDVDGGPVAPLSGFDTTPFSALYGGRLGLGDLTVDGGADLAVAAGRDPAADSTTRAYRYTTASLQPLGGAFVPFTGMYGANVAVARLAY